MCKLTGVVPVITAIRVAAGENEGTDDLGVAKAARVVQRYETAVVPRVDVRAKAQQVVDDLPPTEPGGKVERRGLAAGRVAGVHVLRRDELLDPGEVAVAARLEQVAQRVKRRGDGRGIRGTDGRAAHPGATLRRHRGEEN